MVPGPIGLMPGSQRLKAEAKWYIGPNRAKSLLRYAHGVLAQYAYQIDENDYLSIWNLLRSEIPLWVEERRGPRNRVTGEPLLSEKEYKAYIEWWIYSLVQGRKEQKVSAGLKRSWIGGVFGDRDPAVGVFGANERVKAAADDIDMSALAPLLELDYTSLGPYMVQKKLQDALEMMNSMVTTFAQGNPSARTKLEAARDKIFDWLSTYLTSMMTSADKVENPEAGWANQPVNPLTGNPILREKGKTMADFDKLLQNIVWDAFASAAVTGYSVPEEHQSYRSRVPSPQELGLQQAPWMTSAPAGRPNWPGGVQQIVPVPVPVPSGVDTVSTFAQVLNNLGLGQALVTQVQLQWKENGQYVDSTRATQIVNEVGASMVDKMYPTGVGGFPTAEGAAQLQKDLDDAFSDYISAGSVKVPGA